MRSIGTVSVRSLDLDPENPRLPEAIQGATQPDLLKHLYENDVLDELAQSFLVNEYFPNEPILVLPERGGRRMVVEGNRRTSALMILLQVDTARDAGIEFKFGEIPTASQLAALEEVPAVEVADHSELSAYLGFRHISGLRTWGADAKARYVHQQVQTAVREGSTKPFVEVGRRIGSNAAGVRNAFLAYETLRFAREEFGLSDEVNRLFDERFGVWQRLLNTRHVPEYIGLGGAEREYPAVMSRVAGLQEAQLSRVISDLLPRPDGAPPVLSDSRDVTRYSEVIADDRARETLDKHNDLELAAAIVEMGNLSKRIRNVRQQVEVLQSDVGLAEEVSSDAATEVAQLSYHVGLLKAGIDSKPVTGP